MITPFKGNPLKGYIILKQDEPTFANGWIKIQTRSALLKGELKDLEMITKLKSIPGRIQVCEYLEDNIPQNWLKTLPKAASLQDALTQADAYKKAGTGGAYLTKDGKRIVRFTIYDGPGQSIDTIIQHDNGEEIAASKAAIINKAASLPGGDVALDAPAFENDDNAPFIAPF
jgi:hypothetical protein